MVSSHLYHAEWHPRNSFAAGIDRASGGWVVLNHYIRWYYSNGRNVDDDDDTHTHTAATKAATGRDAIGSSGDTAAAPLHDCSHLHWHQKHSEQHEHEHKPEKADNMKIMIIKLLI